jgi:GH15 family glucan-1,4-alpha-glucosidase
MPRPLALGNGRLLVQLDGAHQIRDLCWPLPGQQNHLAGNAVRWGIWLEGRPFEWLGWEGWTVRIESDEAGAVGHAWLGKSGFPIEIEIESAVDPEQDIFAARFRLHNRSGRSLHPKLFSHHDLRLCESDMAECAYWDPDSEALIHYKMGVHCAIAMREPGRADGQEWGPSFKGADRQGGAWLDCLGGRLSMNPIDQGTIDSALGMAFDLPISGVREAHWSLAIGGGGQVEAAAAAARDVPGVLSRAREAALRRLDRIHIAWERLPGRWAAIGRKQAAILMTQIGSNGAILAANDSDIMTVNRANYSNVWPRDAGLTAMACLEIGLDEAARAALDWAEERILHKGLFLQKYCADGSLGSSWHPRLKGGKAVDPVQIDETASMVELAARMGWNGAAAQKWLRGLLNFADKPLDQAAPGEGILLLPSWDLWEERRGVHFYSMLAAAGALQAAGQDRAAAALRLGLDRLRLPDGGYARMISENGELDTTPDASQILGLLGDLDLLASPDGLRTLERVEEACTAPIGGIARYPNDWYHREGDAPSNPWIICTLWAARARLELGDRDRGSRLMEWCLDRAEPSGVLAEQFGSASGRPLSVSPLTWSHAELLSALRRFAEA